MFTMSSFKVVLAQASKSQKNANEFWLKAWHQACVQTPLEHRNLAPLNMLAEAVHKMPGMVVMPLVEAVLAIGGKMCLRFVHIPSCKRRLLVVDTHNSIFSKGVGYTDSTKIIDIATSSVMYDGPFLGKEELDDELTTYNL